MRPIPAFLATFLDGCEANRLVGYLDAAGHPTIGRGHTDPTVRAGEVITPAESDELLSEDEATAALIVCRQLGTSVALLAEHQYAALISFVFNVGTLGPSIPRLIAGRLLGAVPSVMLKYDHAHVGGKLVKLDGLTRRRQAEVMLWNTADVPAAISAARPYSPVPPTPSSVKAVNPEIKIVTDTPPPTPVPAPVLPTFVETQVASYARAGLMALGGFLVSHGLIMVGPQEDQLVSLGSGLVLLAVTAAWIWVKNKLAHRALDQAVASTPPGAQP